MNWKNLFAMHILDRGNRQFIRTKRNKRCRRWNKKLIKTDSDAETMYYLFKHKNIMPSQYYNMGFGEKTIIKAFIKNEAEEHYKTMKNKNILPVILMK